MVNSFYSKLALALVGIFLLAALMLLVLAEQLTRHYQSEVEQKLHLQLAQHIVKDQNFIKYGEIDQEKLKQSFHDMMILGPSFEFYMLDPTGKIITYSAEPDKIQRSYVDLAPVRELISGQGILPILGQDPRSPERYKIFSAAEIREQEKLKGYLYIIIGGEIYDDLISLLQQSRIVNLGFWGLASSLLFGLIALLLLFFLMTRPLRRLATDMQAFRAQGFTQSNLEFSNWDSKSDNEIHRLGVTFRDMAEELSQQYRQVKEIDHLRRELISHVSHDLRTPLASLQGYLETWQIKHQQMDMEQSAQLIQIALNNAEQISGLVEQLLQLAYLDSDEVELNIEPVAIAELAQDVLLKMELLAEQKQISLSLEPKDPAMLVAADIGKLERVISNLLDNAIRHTPVGGEVHINISREQQALRIMVKDTGIGIPAAELPYIFNPHFRASNSVQSSKNNNGLGLAISKRIIELHLSNIEVLSNPDQGTCFSFTLPLA